MLLLGIDKSRADEQYIKNIKNNQFYILAYS